MTTSDGLHFLESYKSKNIVQYEGLDIPFLSLKDLILNKKTTGRLQDLADAENLIKINQLEEE